MTFVASVIAKDGVAVIADSLVTTSRYIIDFKDFNKFLEDKRKKSRKSDVSVNSKDLINLFKRKPQYTKDFQDKLFRYDKYTAITIAGGASLNEENISDIIDELISINSKDSTYDLKNIEDKITEFCSYIEQKALNHIDKYSTISSLTRFIVTNYNKEAKNTCIYRVNVNPLSKDAIKKDPKALISCELVSSLEKVVCDGQTSLSDSILYGDFFVVNELIDLIAGRLAIDYNVELEKDYRDKLLDIVLEEAHYIRGMTINKLSNLSLQQAVDLSNLLMHIELDFQKFTAELPTVGGVIKLAVINAEGFAFIAGNEIIKPSKL